MNIFTPNMLNIYCECPYKYYYNYVKNIHIPQNDALYVVGKNIHALAEYYLKGEDISKYDLSEKEVVLWQNLKNIDYLRMKPVKIEETLLCKVDDYWIGGRVDAVVNNDDNYYILDYKTGNIPKDYKYAIQTMIYMLCCDKLFDVKTLNFVYINVRKSETQMVTLTDTLKQEYKTRILSIIDNIHKDSFTKHPIIDKCSTCQYNKVCR